MKRRLSEFLLPALLLPFCFGGTTETEKAGYFDPHYFPPLTTGEDSYLFYLTYNYTHKVYESRFIVSMVLYRNQGGPQEITLERYPLSESCPPYRFSFEVDIDYDTFLKGDNKNYLKVAVKNPGYADESYGFFLNYANPTVFTIKEETSSLYRPYVGHYEDFDPSTKNSNIYYEWKGFAMDFEDPEYMVLPLDQMKMRMKDIDGKYVDMPIEKATLSTRDINNISIGELVGPYWSRRREIELDVDFDIYHYTHFQTKEKIIYSPDYRTVRENGRVTAFDHESNSIFLPPVSVGEVRTTEFLLTLTHIGQYNIDIAYYYFDVVQTHNYIGSRPVSDWHVEEC